MILFIWNNQDEYGSYWDLLDVWYRTLRILISPFRVSGMIEHNSYNLNSKDKSHKWAYHREPIPRPHCLQNDVYCEYFINNFIDNWSYKHCTILSVHNNHRDYSDGLMQERCNSSANALELHLSCTKHWYQHGQYLTKMKLCRKLVYMYKCIATHPFCVGNLWTIWGLLFFPHCEGVRQGKHFFPLCLPMFPAWGPHFYDM